MAHEARSPVAHAEISAELREQLADLARANERTLAGEIRKALAEHVEREALHPKETH